MDITHLRKQVAKDFRDKIISEKRLVPILRRFNREVIIQFRRDVMKGMITRSDKFQPELQQILEEHYKMVSKKFNSRVSDDAPKDVALTDEEKAILAAAIASLTISRSNTQSRLILDTTQNDMITAVKIVTEDTPDQTERAVVASAILSRRLQSRTGAIASLETQAIAEATKAIEFDVFAKRSPLSLQPSQTRLEKQWVTVGDERVRPAHVQADAQLRNTGEPYLVGGEQLRYPGDTSLGATASNVIRCRCSSVGDNGSVYALRREVGDMPTPRTIPSEGLITSLGG